MLRSLEFECHRIGLLFESNGFSVIAQSEGGTPLLGLSDGCVYVELDCCGPCRAEHIDALYYLKVDVDDTTVERYISCCGFVEQMMTMMLNGRVFRACVGPPCRLALLRFLKIRIAEPLHIRMWHDWESVISVESCVEHVEGHRRCWTIPRLPEFGTIHVSLRMRCVRWMWMDHFPIAFFKVPVWTPVCILEWAMLEQLQGQGCLLVNTHGKLCRSDLQLGQCGVHNGDRLELVMRTQEINPNMRRDDKGELMTMQSIRKRWISWCRHPADDWYSRAMLCRRLDLPILLTSRICGFSDGGYRQAPVVAIDRLLDRIVLSSHWAWVDSTANCLM